MNDKVCKSIETSIETVSTMKVEIDKMETLIKLFWSIGAMIVGLCVYWLLEPDPLTIKTSSTNQEIYVCIDNSFDFERYVKLDKRLSVTVEPRLKDLRTNQTYILESKVYEGHKQEGIITFRHRIDTTYPTGIYEYQPYLTYNVNPIKKVNKKAPTQTVLFGCKVDSETLSSIDDVMKDRSIDKETKIYFLNDIMVNW